MHFGNFLFKTFQKFMSNYRINQSKPGCKVHFLGQAEHLGIQNFFIYRTLGHRQIIHLNFYELDNLLRVLLELLICLFT